MTVKELMWKFGNDPEFAKLDYSDQSTLKAEMLSEALAKEPAFTSLDPVDRSLLFQEFVMSAPALEDKNLQGVMTGVVEGMKSQDPKIASEAKRAAEAISQDQAFAAQSLLYRGAMFVGGGLLKGIEGLLPPELRSRAVEIEAQAATSNPRDTLKMGQYFEEQFQPESGEYRRTQFVKAAAPIMGNLLDWSSMGVMVGASAGAGTGLGRLAMSAAYKAGERAVTISGKLLASVAKSVSHAALTGAVGTARENAMEIIRQGEVNPDVKQLLANNAKWFAGYFLGDAIFNVMLDTVVPTVRGMSQIWVPKGQVKQGLKGFTDLEIRNKLIDILEGRELPPELISQIDKNGSWRAMQATSRVMRKLGSASEEDLVTTFLTHHGLNMTKRGGGGYQIQLSMPQANLIEAGERVMGQNYKLSQINFKDLKAVKVWFSQIRDERAGIVGVPFAKGGAAMTWANFKREDIGLTALGEEHILTDAGLKKWQDKVDDLIPFLTKAEQQANKNWIYLDYTNGDALVKAAKAMEGNPVVQQKLQALLKEMGVEDKVVIYRGTKPKEDPGLYQYTNGSFALDEARLFKKDELSFKRGAKPDTIKPTDIKSQPGDLYAYLVPRKNIVGFGAKSEGEVYWKTEGSTFLGHANDPDLRKIHSALVEDAYRKGYMVPQKVAEEYPDLLPPYMRPMASMEAEAGAYQAELNSVIRGKIKDPKTVDVMTRLFAPKAGVWRKDQLQSFVDHFGATMGLKKEGLASLKVETTVVSGLEKMEERMVFVTPSGRYVFPKGPAKSAESDALRKVTDMIVTEAEKAGVMKGEMKGLVKGLQEGYGSSILNQKIFTPQWTTEVANSMGLEMKHVSPNRWQLLDPKTGTAIVDGTLDTVKLQLVHSSIDEGYFKAYLSTQGFTLRQSKDKQFHVLMPGSSEPFVSGESVQEILKKEPSLMPKVPSTLGPELAVVVAGKRVDVIYQKGVAVGSYENLMQGLDGYSNAALINQKMSLHSGKGGYIYSNRLTKQLEVFIPETGYRKYFDKVDEAQAYLKDGWKSMSEVQRMANVKGYIVHPMGGGYVVWSNGIAIKAKGIEEVRAILRDVPVPEWAPELSGMTEDSLVGLKLAGDGAFRPVNPVEPGLTPTGWDIRKQFIDTPGMWFEHWVRKGGDEGMLKLFHEIETTRRAVIGADHEAGQWLHTIHSPGGKLLKEDRRELIGYYLNAKGQDKLDLAGKLTGDELKVAGQLREFYDGLKIKYGVDPRKFKEVYFPHIQKWVLENPSLQYTEGDVGKLLRDAFDPTPPKELDAFFKHWRVSDVLSTAMEADSLKAAMKYVAVGNRQLIQGDVWRRAMDHLASTTDETMALRFKMYLNDIKGLPQGSSAVVLKQAALQDLARMGLAGGPAHSLLDTMMSVGYTAALGFSPWKAVRNTLDIYVTVAPRLGWDGNEWISQSFKEVHADRTGIIFNRLKAAGDITGAQRVAGGEDFLTTGPMGKVLTSGMAWYKNSDELTRAVAYHAAELKWEDAFRRYRTGMEGKGKVMTEDAFEEMSGFVSLGPTKANEIRGYIREGKWDVAKAAWSSRLVEETLFPYRGGLTPLVFRGVVGKLFGMMGHYPVYYVENIRRAIQYGTPATKMAFAGLFLANSAALYGTMRLLGTTGQDYVPWNPAAFTGGPYYQMMNMGLQSLGRGYQGRQARAELFGIQTDQESPLGFKVDITKSTMAKWFIPGGFQLVKMQKALDFHQQGDNWSAWLSMMGATPDPKSENLFEELAQGSQG